MTPSQTTFWGAVAGASMAAQAIPSLPPLAHTVAIVASGLATGALGYHAAECPANCPGTDTLGKRRVPAAGNILAAIVMVGGLLLALAFAVMASGCTAIYGHAYEKGDATNNVPKKGATLYGFTILDSGQVLGKTRLTYEAVSNGWYAPGVGTAGFQQTSSSTGVVTIIQQFGNLVPAAAAAAAPAK